MKTLFKIQAKTKTFFIRASNTTIYVSIEKNRTKTKTTVFEFNISKSRLLKIAIILSSLLGVSGLISKLFA